MERNKDMRLYTLHEKNMSEDFKTLQIKALQQELERVTTAKVEDVLNNMNKIRILSNQRGLEYSKDSVTINNFKVSEGVIELNIDYVR